MTPKEKAKELFDKFCLAIQTEGNEFGYWTNTIHAKQCVLIAVDKILDELQINYNEQRINFYLEVRQEIEKL